MISGDQAGSASTGAILARGRDGCLHNRGVGGKVEIVITTERDQPAAIAKHVRPCGRALAAGLVQGAAQILCVQPGQFGLGVILKRLHGAYSMVHERLAME
jgi:hypothetical protein